MIISVEKGDHEYKGHHECRTRVNMSAEKGDHIRVNKGGKQG